MSFEKLKPGCGCTDLDPEIGYFDGELDIEIEFPEEGESAHLVSEKLECEEGGIQKEECESDIEMGAMHLPIGYHVRHINSIIGLARFPRHILGQFEEPKHCFKKLELSVLEMNCARKDLP